MPRRSWRDLPPGPGPDEADGARFPSAAPVPPADLLHRAATGDPRLSSLLAERDQLEAQLSELTGAVGQGGSGQDPRFPITGLRERREEIASWAAARDTRAGDRGRDSRKRRTRTGLDEGRRGPGTGHITEAGAGLNSQLFGPLRSGLDSFDQVRSTLERSDGLLERPRELADGLEQRWQQAEEQSTAPLDRVGRYAEVRDRILDVTTGGSGDLTERAEAARRRALELRAAADREARRIARRRERHHEHRAAEQRETARLDRRTSAGKGD